MKRSPINKVSKRRIRHNLAYQRAKREYMESHPICEACLCCKSESLHHKKGRGILLADPRYFMATCNLCHSKIEMNRRWAFEMGFLIDRIGI